MPRIYC